MALIDISRLSFTYEGSYDPVFQDLSLQLDTDWRLGLIGRNGRGKTTLLRLLMGQETYRGTISSPVAFDYFPFSVPDGARTVWKNWRSATGSSGLLIKMSEANRRM